jgi:DNA-binding MarR family transcriptional regulator
MTTDLRDELQQQKPFGSLQQEAQLSIARTEAELRDLFERMLRPHGVSAAQYNVLRILRGAGPDGLCRNEVRDRLISRMPDVTRLLDRMEQAGLVTRARSSVDRRLVATQLTERGRSLVDSLDAIVAEEHQRRLGHLSQDQLRTLIELLALIRKHV